MSRYIDADKIEYAPYTVCRHNGKDVTEMIAYKKLIDIIPAADVKEVIHAHWIPKQYPFGNCECSNCHEEYGICGGLMGDYNYCPNCGAKMDGGKE